MEPDFYGAGRGEIVSISPKRKGLTMIGRGFNRYFSCSEEMLAGLKVGQTVKFRCSMTYNEFEKAWRPGEMLAIQPEAPGAVPAGK